jgi:hypothetical protein
MGAWTISFVSHTGIGGAGDIACQVSACPMNDFGNGFVTGTVYDYIFTGALGNKTTITCSNNPVGNTIVTPVSYLVQNTWYDFVTGDDRLQSKRTVASITVSDTWTYRVAYVPSPIIRTGDLVILRSVLLS